MKAAVTTGATIMAIVSLDILGAQALETSAAASGRVTRKGTLRGTSGSQ
jgi:hypothetical protein